jgi:hypothetical protein
MTRNIVFSFFLIFLCSTGCSSYSRQFEAIRSVNNDQENDVREFLWEASLLDSNIEIYPVTLTDHTAFANREGWILRFNGWDIFEVIIPEIEINTFFDFAEANVSVTGTFNYILSCMPWDIEDEGPNIRHIKNCSNGDINISNYLIVNDLGETVEIHHFISPDIGYLHLKKL